MDNKNKTFRSVLIALFCAIIIVQNFVPFFGYIPVGPLNLTTIHVTVIIAAIVLGPRDGAIVGGVWGLITFIRAYVWPTSPLATIVFVNPLVSIVPRILIGVVVGYVSDGTNQFGEKDNPIKVYGSIQKNGLAKTEITPGNIDTYKCGVTKGTTTIYASCPYSFIKVMSFNIRESKWEERQSAVLEMLNTEKPDIIGLQ